ncbi:MAG: cbb3-type cytochrome c oxidase subunit II [Verrucomicrobiota bacterium]|nr:cbb3-type cytochrome c oxidase subunit II [Verrucomicrobiota bacterium]
MKGLAPLLLGIFGTFAFSWVGLILIPNAQFGHLEPQMDEDGGDAYPAPKSGMAERGRKIYVANGCVYCHTQQVRPDYAASDIERKWGDRRSAPRDYIFDRPVLLGKMRMGPDLANIGKRAPVDDVNAPAPDATKIAAAASPVASPATSPATSPAAVATNAASPGPAVAPSSAPAVGAQTAEVAAPAPNAAGSNGDSAPLLYSAAWHHRHLYDPRSLVPESTMPSYRFLYDKRRISGEHAADAVNLTGPTAAAGDYEIVPTYDARCLVAYLMSLDQSHALKEVKSIAPAAPPAPGKAVK